MEMGKILSADVLDIIFDQRNKEYGAYDLRKHYQARLTKALVITLMIVALICLTYILLGSMKPKAVIMLVTPDITLDKIPDNDKTVEKIPAPPKKIMPPLEIKSIQFTKPLIVQTEPPEIEKPPINDDLDHVKISTVTKDGQENGDIIEPPVAVATGVVDIPRQQNEEDKLWAGAVEIESQYPGGLTAWGAFLYRNLVYPQQAIENDKQGTVTVQFIVDTQGSVSDVTVISGPEELRAAAVTVIKKSGKWTPAIQNGRKVKTYKKQPITFKLAE